MRFDKEKLMALQLSVELYNKMMIMQQKDDSKAIKKEDAFDWYHIQKSLIPRSQCYFCEYAYLKEKEERGKKEECDEEETVCVYCPVKNWTNIGENISGRCLNNGSPFTEWARQTAKPLSVPDLLKSLSEMIVLLKEEMDEYIDELLKNGVEEDIINDILNTTRISTFHGFGNK